MVRVRPHHPTHGLTQVNAHNEFITINRKVLLHNIEFICSEIAIYVHNCYIKLDILFVTGGVEISPDEGSTQGDPIAMPLYSVGVTPLLMAIKTQNVKHAAFADDLNGAGYLNALNIWWDLII